MYNKPFNIEITSTTPYAYNNGDEKAIGITFTGEVQTKQKDFLADVVVEKKLEGLETILRGELPITGTVDLEILPRGGVELEFPGIKNRPCELVSLAVYPGLVDGTLKAVLKIKVPALHEKSAGVIVSKLRHAIAIGLILAQGDLFAKKKDSDEKSEREQEQFQLKPVSGPKLLGDGEKQLRLPKNQKKEKGGKPVMCMMCNNIFPLVEKFTEIEEGFCYPRKKLPKETRNIFLKKITHVCGKCYFQETDTKALGEA